MPYVKHNLESKVAILREFKIKSLSILCIVSYDAWVYMLKFTVVRPLDLLLLPLNM